MSLYPKYVFRAVTPPNYQAPVLLYRLFPQLFPQSVRIFFRKFYFLVKSERISRVIPSPIFAYKPVNSPRHEYFGYFLCNKSVILTVRYRLPDFLFAVRRKLREIESDNGNKIYQKSERKQYFFAFLEKKHYSSPP